MAQGCKILALQQGAAVAAAAPVRIRDGPAGRRLRPLPLHRSGGQGAQLAAQLLDLLLLNPLLPLLMPIEDVFPVSS